MGRMKTHASARDQEFDALICALDHAGVNVSDDDLAALLWLSRRRATRVHATRLTQLLLTLTEAADSDAIRALLIPARRDTSCTLVHVVVSSTCYALALEAALVDDVIQGHGYAIYADERRTSDGLPRNPRALQLLDRLDARDALDALDADCDLRGTVLVVGQTPDGVDSTLGGHVLDAARDLGLVQHPSARAASLGKPLRTQRLGSLMGRHPALGTGGSCRPDQGTGWSAG